MSLTNNKLISIVTVALVVLTVGIVGTKIYNSYNSSENSTNLRIKAHGEEGLIFDSRSSIAVYSWGKMKKMKNVSVDVSVNPDKTCKVTVTDNGVVSEMSKDEFKTAYGSMFKTEIAQLEQHISNSRS